ncbi:uncharacterized protein BO87DRAFT_56762 [Aspergillus neoniger CBS 115656]|uniref:Uncharacterized protein n=1 Tax=Aspergillus neoniger (strain CBS 115656) TaxID=1448310 RepID=A0A318YIY2_ASPNB|nr:hypothetical protein BO87DRAFT_56762 [Aspergillus neoniger CBS 115656]PYH34326.1 hypothetical protein BO87DRAFT_56762 [Aspergillus neoniger CBS 115656]
MQLGMPKLPCSFLSHPHPCIHTQWGIFGTIPNKNLTNLRHRIILIISFALLFLREHSELYFPAHCLFYLLRWLTVFHMAPSYVRVHFFDRI